MAKIEKSDQMFDMVERWQASGLSQTRFAVQEGFHIAKLRYWIKRHRSSQLETSAFVQIGGIAGSSIHLRLPNGVELSLPGQTPLAYLKSLVQIF